MKKVIPHPFFAIEQMHFIGIYGISMSSLAILCAKRGYNVSGSDTGEGTESLRKMLSSAGIRIYKGHSPQNLPEASAPETVAVVYSAAITEENTELDAAKRLGMRIFGRTELMELITHDVPVRLGVSGTHGKSTVCGMITEIFLAAKADPDVLCGAELPSLGAAWRCGSGERIIYEACEYRSSFLKLRPTHAIVTNIEEEHMDHFRNIDHIRNAYYQYANGAEKAIVCIDSEESGLLARRLGRKAVTCSLTDRTADYYAEAVVSEWGRYTFDLIARGTRIRRISLKVVGKHNCSNAVIAAASAIECGISPQAVADGLSGFCGVKRRMEYRGMLNGAVIYDDYAHHPTEIKATLAAARSMGFTFISCAFQPHTYSRTARFFRDFTEAFSDADEILFTDIYAAREQNTYGVSSRDLAEATKNGIYLPSRELIAERFKSIAAPGVLLLTMGAGELDRVAEMLPLN